MITGHVSRPSNFLLMRGLEIKRSLRLLMIPISGSTQPRVSVKYIHPFWLKGVELSEPLPFYQSFPLTRYGYTAN